MPLRGEGHSDLVRDEAPYFKSLAELDAWFAQPHDKLSGVLPYQPRLFDGQWDSRGKLLVGHNCSSGCPISSDLSIRFATIIKSVNPCSCHVRLVRVDPRQTDKTSYMGRVGIPNLPRHYATPSTSGDSAIPLFSASSSITGTSGN